MTIMTSAAMSVENSGVRFHAERNFPAKKSRMMPASRNSAPVNMMPMRLRPTSRISRCSNVSVSEAETRAASLCAAATSSRAFSARD